MPVYLSIDEKEMAVVEFDFKTNTFLLSFLDDYYKKAEWLCHNNKKEEMNKRLGIFDSMLDAALFVKTNQINLEQFSYILDMNDEITLL